MPHTQDGKPKTQKKTQKPLVLLSDLLELPSKKQKVFVSCKGATAGSPQYVSTHFLPRSLNALEILTVNFWISFFGCFSNFKACLILIILFVGWSVVTLPQ
jgi:type IV secretory pathway TraG/TraD family ATPase VirD4